MENKISEKEINIKFIKFLKKNQCYNEYKINFKEDIIRRKYSPLIKNNFASWIKNKYFHHKDEIIYFQFLIYYAFQWKDTPQGNDYWNKISEQWKKEIRQLPGADELKSYYTW